MFGGIDWEDAGEGAPVGEVGYGGLAVVGDGSADFEAAGDFLRMVALDAGAEWKVGRAAEDEVEAFVRLQDFRITDVSFPDIEAISETVPFHRFLRELDTFALGLDGYDGHVRQSPGGDHSDGADPAAEVEDVSRARAP